MTFYCTRCGTGVEADFHFENVQGDEVVKTAVCPNCGRRLTLKACRCAICGEWHKAEDPACLNCEAEIVVDITNMVRAKGWSRNVWEAFAGCFDNAYDWAIKEGGI